MSKKRKVANPLALAVLSYLSQRPMHPYELSRTLRAHGDDRSIKFNHGSLYMVVGQLEKAGFVTAQDISREGQRPERTTYALTDTGRVELYDWLRDLLQEPAHEYPGFVTALSLIAALSPRDAVTLLTDRLRRLGERRSEIDELIDTTTDHGVHPLFLVEEEYRRALLDAEVSFIEEFLGRISEPTSPWRKAWEDAREQIDKETSP